MKLILASALLVTLACATTGASSTARTAGIDAQSCSPLVPAVVTAPGANVFSRPDSTSLVLASLDADSAVCADSSKVGFGFRRVKLPDGRSGFVSDTSLQ